MVLKPEQKKTLQLFMAAWLHYVKISKEKRELLLLSQAEVNKVLIRYTFNAWKNLRKTLTLRKARHSSILHHAFHNKLRHSFQVFVKAKNLSKRKNILKNTAKTFNYNQVLSTKFYSWKCYVEYQKSMKRRVQKLMDKSVKGEGFIDRKTIEQLYKEKRKEFIANIVENTHVQMKGIVKQKQNPRVIKKVIEEKPKKNVTFSALRNQRLYDTLSSHHAINKTGVTRQKQQTVPQSKTLKPPNQLYKKLEDRLYKERVPTASFFAKQACLSAGGEDEEVSSVTARLKEHAKQALISIRVLAELPLKYHRTTVNARKSPVPETVNEMIQHSLTSKRLSMFFTQWKMSFLIKWIVSDFRLIRCYRYAHSFFGQLKADLHSEKQRQKQVEKEYEMRYMCQILRGWKIWARQMKFTNEKKMRHFREQWYFRKWKKYIVKTANKLIAIIKASEHYQRRVKRMFIFTLLKLTSESATAKSLYRTRMGREYLGRWMGLFKRRSLLRKIVQIKEKQEAKKYAAQYLLLQRVIKKWRDEARKWTGKKNRRIRLLAADNFRNGILVSKYYFLWKGRTGVSIGGKLLSALLLNRSVRPRFEHWRVQSKESHILLNEYKTARQSLTLYQCFTAWKQESIDSKLSKIFRMKLSLRGWWLLTSERRIALPYGRYEAILKQKCLRILKMNRANGWKTRRANIIYKEMSKLHERKLKKLALISLLENVMKEKKQQYLPTQKQIGKALQIKRWRSSVQLIL
eukprot:TRINITY_DN1105_c0_g1_i1.p1 TRINITY_DN1105_c0_g1~~TRINITY_DN1105_c0_g1_i1.p1  ORF type:complete len:743 (+),score=57.11 TRINITY_DN1105_c0_g1_i1:1381-3609(+)